jgi:hypothetical protein
MQALVIRHPWLKGQRLQHPCCRDAAFELRYDKELAASYIIMKSMTAPPAGRFYN